MPTGSCGLLASTASACTLSSRFVLPGRLLWERDSLQVLFLMDSTDEGLARQPKLPLGKLVEPRVVQDWDGHMIARPLPAGQNLWPF